MQNNRNDEKVKISKNFFTYQVIGQDKKTNKHIRSLWVHIFILLLILITIWSLSKLNLAINKFGFDIFTKNLKNLFKFTSKSSYGGIYSDNLWIKSLLYLWQTIKYALVGSFIGWFLAIITSIISNKKYSNKYSGFIARNIILFLRAIPELVFIQLFTLAFSSNSALIIIFAWFSWLWLHKYFIEILDNTDKEPYLIAISQGNSKFKAFWKEIVPRVINRMTSLGLYSFESNMRWASLLAALGASGIGVLINFAGSSLNYFSELGIPLLVLVIFVIFLEVFNFLINKYVFEINTKEIKNILSLKNSAKANKTEIYEKLAAKINWRFYAKLIALIFLAIFSIYLISNEYWTILLPNQVKHFFKAIFTPDWMVFDLKSFDVKSNPILQILQSFSFAISVLVVTLAISIITIPLCSRKTNNQYAAINFRIINALVRLVPSIIFIYLFNPIFESSIALLILVLGMHEASSMTKQISEAVDNVDQTFIQNLRMQGYSKMQIYFRFILPSVRGDLYSLIIFYFEICFRNSITYSFFANGELIIGSQISLYLDGSRPSYMPNKAMAYIWIATLAILLINYIGDLLTRKIIKNIHNNSQVKNWIIKIKQEIFFKKISKSQKLNLI